MHNVILGRVGGATVAVEKQ